MHIHNPRLETEATIVRQSLNAFYYEWLTSNIYVVQRQAEGTDSIHKSITDTISQILLRLKMQHTTIF